MDATAEIKAIDGEKAFRRAMWCRIGWTKRWLCQMAVSTKNRRKIKIGDRKFLWREIQCAVWENDGILRISLKSAQRPKNDAAAN